MVQTMMTTILLWWIVMNCDELWWIVMNCDELWWIVMNCDELWWIVMDCDELWWIVMDCDELWWIVINCDESCSAAQLLSCSAAQLFGCWAVWLLGWLWLFPHNLAALCPALVRNFKTDCCVWASISPQPLGYMALSKQWSSGINSTCNLCKFGDIWSTGSNSHCHPFLNPRATQKRPWVLALPTQN